MAMILPIPPYELRDKVGPTDEAAFDNPGGQPIYPYLSADAWDFVFDFGCGCGRLARQMIQQTPRPKQYLGVDPHHGLVDWATANLTAAAPNFRFAHHDVYSPGYAPGNSLRLADRFPVEDGKVTLLIAHSVFTHLSRDQTEFYLAELRRVLAPRGQAYTSWFFFDNASMPFFKEGPHALYADEKDFSAAVLFDRQWFLSTIQQAGLRVARTHLPSLPGHQWGVWLEPRKAGSTDEFPMGEAGAEFLSGAACKPTAAMQAKPKPTPRPLGVEPPLYGALLDVAAARQDAEFWKNRAMVWRGARKVARIFGLSR